MNDEQPSQTDSTQSPEGLPPSPTSREDGPETESPNDAHPIESGKPALLVAGGFYWPGWFLWSFLVLLMRLGHPPVRDEARPLGRGRKLLALVALLMLVASFMPVPVEMVWIQQ